MFDNQHIGFVYSSMCSCFSTANVVLMAFWPICLVLILFPSELMDPKSSAGLHIWNDSWLDNVDQWHYDLQWWWLVLANGHRASQDSPLSQVIVDYGFQPIQTLPSSICVHRERKTIQVDTQQTDLSEKGYPPPVPTVNAIFPIKCVIWGGIPHFRHTQTSYSWLATSHIMYPLKKTTNMITSPSLVACPLIV